MFRKQSVIILLNEVGILECVVQPKELGVEGKISSAARSGLNCHDLGCGSEIRMTLTRSIVGTPAALIQRNFHAMGKKRVRMFRKQSVINF